LFFDTELCGVGPGVKCEFGALLFPLQALLSMPPLVVQGLALLLAYLKVRGMGLLFFSWFFFLENPAPPQLGRAGASLGELGDLQIFTCYV